VSIRIKYRVRIVIQCSGRAGKRRRFFKPDHGDEDDRRSIVVVLTKKVKNILKSITNCTLN
jgi:hypothetical protein